MVFLTFLSLSSLHLLLASAHIAAWHPSMWGFNFTTDGNRPVDPLMDMTFKQWWFHDHLAYPPNKDDFLEFPAGGKTTIETTCDKGASSYFDSNPGGQIKPMPNETNYPCPFKPTSEFHTESFDDTKGCAFGIAYIPPSQVNSIQPEDFTIFSTVRRCVWTRYTDFHVPARMPACPPGGCTCAWFWVHSQDSGSEQIYMNGFQCKITNVQSNAAPLAKPQVPRRCGLDDTIDPAKPADSKNCTYGAKQPIYWLNKERNNLFEDAHHPPFYNELYAWTDGAQEDIFVDSELPEMSWAGAPVKVNGVYESVKGEFGDAKEGGGGGAPAAAPSSSASTSSSPPPAASKSAPKRKPKPASPPSSTNSSSSSPPPSSSDSDSDSSPPPSSDSDSDSKSKPSPPPKCDCKGASSPGKKGTKTVTVIATETVTASYDEDEVQLFTTTETRTISPAEASQLVSSSSSCDCSSEPKPPSAPSQCRMRTEGEGERRRKRSSKVFADKRRSSAAHYHRLHRRPRTF